MKYLQITILLLASISATSPMPIDHDEPTTESSLTTAVTEELETTAAPDDWILSTTIPSSAESDGADQSLESPSQTVEIRLHPQLIQPEQPKASQSATTSSSMDAFVLSTTKETASSGEEQVPAAKSEEDLEANTSSQASGNYHDDQQQHGVYSSLTGRFRLKDSIGAALRRAITSSPLVHKVQNLPGRTSGLARHSASVLRSSAKDGEITARKINFATGLSSNLPAASRLPVTISRHEPGRHRLPLGGGETPAGTRTESESDWLYAAHRDGKRPLDLFRIPSPERWLGYGARTDRITQASTETNKIEATSTTRVAETSPSTTVPPSTETPASSTNENDSATSTSSETKSSAMPAMSGVTPEINYATPEINHATPETNHATPETIHGTREIQWGRPEADFISSKPSQDQENEQPTTQRAETHSHEVNHATERSTEIELSSTITPTSSEVLQDSRSHTQSTDDVTTQTAFITKAIVPLFPIAISVDPSAQLTDETPDVGSPSQQLESLPIDDSEEESEEESVENQNENETDSDAHKYLVEEKTPDGYIVGEFGVINRSSGNLRGVRYTAHGSTNPQLIQDALRTFLSLK